MKHLPLDPLPYRDLPAKFEPDHETGWVRVADRRCEPAGATATTISTGRRRSRNPPLTASASTGTTGMPMS